MPSPSATSSVVSPAAPSRGEDGPPMTTTAPLDRDPSLPIDARVANLLARMTRAEKVAQLGSFWALEVIKESGFDEGRLAERVADGIGHVTRLAGSTNLRPAGAAEASNGIQR